MNGILRLVYFAALLSLTFTSQGQVVPMKAGDSFSHQFTGLPRFGDGAGGGEVAAQGIVGIKLSGDLFDGSDEIRVDMFSDQVDGAFIGTRTLAASVLGKKRIDVAINGAWKELKGAFRVTLTKGSITITNVLITVVLVSNLPPYPATYYGMDVPLMDIFPPALKSRLIGDSIELSWPELYGDFMLEATPSMKPESEWLKMDYTPVASEGTFKFTNKISAATAFYRLRK